MLATLLLTLTLVSAWVFGSDTLALAFTQAEVSMLFPAPLTRRGLIGYKIFRAQIGVLINALIWVFILRRGGTALPSLLRTISLWVLFSTLNLHRLGAALVWSAWREHGQAGFRRNWIAIAIFALMAARSSPASSFTAPILPRSPTRGHSSARSRSYCRRYPRRSRFTRCTSSSRRRSRRPSARGRARCRSPSRCSRFTRSG